MSATKGTEPVRSQSFECSGPAELDLRINRGRIDVRAADVTHVRADVSFEAGDGRPPDSALRALQDVQITFSESSRRLVVRTPRELRRARLALSVEAPARSRLAARLHNGPVAAVGLLSGLDAATGAGDITAEDVEGEANVRTGSGDVRVRQVAGRFRARNGSGGVDVELLAGGQADMATGSGDVRLGRVDGDVNARSGSGSLTVAQATRGRLRLTTGSGDVRVAIPPGAGAELDLASGSGRARSDLDISEQPLPGASPSVFVRARTGSGDAVVTRATG